MVSSVGQIILSSLALGVLSSGVSVSVKEHTGLGAQEAMRESALEATWATDLQAMDSTNKANKMTPIQRVVKLLKEMKANLEKEAKADEELYDQMVCWCETNEKEKTKAIADADAKDKDLVSEIEERAARHGVLATDIEYTKGDIAEFKEALQEAQKMREKDQGEFMSSEKEMIQAITNLKNAIQVLSKHHGGSLIQLSPAVQASLGPVLRDVAEKHEELLGDHMGSKKNREAFKAALISITADTHRQTSEDSSEAATALRGLKNALNPYAVEDVDSDVPVKFAAKVLARQAAESKKVKMSLVQQGSYSAKSSDKYAPASDQIFGMLQQMKEEFETNLAASQKEEVKGQEDYTALKATKEEQLAAAETKLEEMQLEFADNKKAKYDAKEDLEVTRTQRSEDVEFLRNLKTTCGDLDHQFEMRTKMRTEEIKAVAETIGIVTSDDARDLMSKTVTFLQTESQTTLAEKAMRVSAAAVLRKALGGPNFDDLMDAWNGRNAPVMDSPRVQLAMLTTSVQLDAFVKVKKAMDDMIAELKDQQKEEVKLKEFCTKEFNQNEQDTYKKTEEKGDLQQKIEGLSSDIERLTEEIKEAGETIATTEKEILKASQAREKENAEFQQTVADQRATQVILKKALKKLNDFYKKSFLQHGQTPPVKFKPMKKSSGASPVIGMIEQIIEESVQVEADAVAGEKSAQSDYETFVADSKSLIKELKNAITEKTKSKANAEAEKVSSEAELESVEEELEALSSYKADLHEQCDFVVKNFDIRQKARLQEIEAIQEAKGILSGAK